MSKVVDSRVVEMRFDNAQFERNVKTNAGNPHQSPAIPGDTAGEAEILRSFKRS